MSVMVQPHIKIDFSKALDTEIYSTQALNEIILDGRGYDFLGSTFNKQRRRSSANSNQLLIPKKDGPSIGFKLLSATLVDLNRRIPKVPKTDSNSSSTINSEHDDVASWFVSTKSNASITPTPRPDQEEPKLDTKAAATGSRSGSIGSLMSGPGPGSGPRPSRGFLYAVLASEHFKSSGQRRKQQLQQTPTILPSGPSKPKANRIQPITVAAPNGPPHVHFSLPPPPPPLRESTVPSLERVQEHIARVKTLVGQQPSLPSSSSGRPSPAPTATTTTEKQKLGLFLRYRAPFPALKRRRENTHHREKYLHSLIQGHG